MSRRLALAVALALAAPGRGARADGSATPEVRLAACLRADAAAVRRLLAIELGASAGPPQGALGARVLLASCRGDTVVLEVWEAGRQLASDAVNVQAVSTAARPRLLALALAELATWEPGRVTQPDVPRAIAAISAAAPLRQPEAAKSSLALSAFASARLNAGSGAVWGAGPAVALDRGPVALRFELLAELGGRETPAGKTRLVAGSVAAAGLLAHRGSVGALAAGAGLRLGGARLSGRPASDRYDPGVLWGPWGGPFARAEATLGVAQPVRVALEAGLALVTLTGRAARVHRVALSGHWVGMQISVGAWGGPR
jgi:hypothetical protein